jgi:hypothetical protein
MVSGREGGYGETNSMIHCVVFNYRGRMVSGRFIRSAFVPSPLVVMVLSVCKMMGLNK